MSTETSGRVSITVNPSFWEFFVASLELIRYCPRFIIVHAIFPLFGIFLLLTPFITGNPLGVFEIILVVAAFMYGPLITALSVWLIRRRNKLAEGPFAYSFDAEGMHTSGTAFNQTIRWSAIPRIRSSMRFLFIFIAPAKAHIIPLKAITDQKFFDSLRDIAGHQTDFRILQIAKRKF